MSCYSIIKNLLYSIKKKKNPQFQIASIPNNDCILCIMENAGTKLADAYFLNVVVTSSPRKVLDP
jgi:hypothetical protein